MSSEIFDAYAKIAIEKGLIKQAKENDPLKESKELKSYKNDSYPRMGSDTLEIIEALYKTMPPEQPKSQQYKRNIMEVAHPHKVILTPAYDKMNALIENNNERQRVLLNIVNKPVNGQLTNHKYAQEALATSLIAVANDLDNREMEALRILADECIEELHKTAFEWSDLGKWFSEEGENVVDVGKGTLGGAELGAIAGGLVGAFGGPIGIGAGALLGAKAGAVLGGVLSAIFNTGPEAKNVSHNAQVAKSALEGIMEDHKDDIFLTSLDSALNKVSDTSAAYGQIVDQMHIKNADEGAKNAAISVAVAYQNQLRELDRLIDIFLSNAKLGKYAPEENDAWAKIKSPFTAIFGDSVHKAVEAFEMLEQVNKTALEGIKATKLEASSAKEAVSEAKASAPQTSDGKPMPEKGSADWFSKMTESINPFMK